jgi:hypothetical protein
MLLIDFDDYDTGATCATGSCRWGSASTTATTATCISSS